MDSDNAELKNITMDNISMLFKADDNGLINAVGKRYILMGISNCAILGEQIRTRIGSSAYKGLVYCAAKQAGISMGEGVSELIKGGTVEDLAKTAGMVGTVAGWGRFEFPELHIDRAKLSGNSIVRLYNGWEASAFLSEFGQSDEPVCPYTAGFIAGVGAGIVGAEALKEMDDDVDCIETKCMCKGDDYCEFLVTTHSEYMKRRMGDWSECGEK